MGRSYHQQGNLNDAQRCYQEAVTLNLPRSNYHCEVLLGLACQEQGTADPTPHFVAGLESGRDILAKSARLYDAWHYLALTQLCLGQKNEALTSYEKSTRICLRMGALQGACHDLQLLERTAPDTSGLREAVALLEAAMSSLG